jgi:hypothetical protein
VTLRANQKCLGDQDIRLVSWCMSPLGLSGRVGSMLFHRGILLVDGCTKPGGEPIGFFGRNRAGHARRLCYRCVWQVPARRSLRRVGALTMRCARESYWVGKSPPGALTSSGSCRAWASRRGVSSMSETVDSLTVYCRDNKRVCRFRRLGSSFGKCCRRKDGLWMPGNRQCR